MSASIRRQFVVVFVGTLALSLAAAGAVISELNRTQRASRDFMEVGAARLELARRIEATLYRAESAEDLFLSRAQPADLERFRALARELHSDGERLRTSLDDDAARAGILKLLAHFADYAQLVDKEAEVTLGHEAVADPSAFRALLVRRGEALAAAQSETQRALEGVLAAGPVFANRVEQSFGRLGLWMLALLLAVAGGGFATWTVGNGIVRRLSSMATTIGEITNAADLDRRLAVESADELGTLSMAFNSLLSAQQASVSERAQAALRDKERADAIEAAYRELSQATEALRKSQQKLMESDKLATIGQLSAGIAHEVNNPAASIIGNLEFLKKELEPLLVELEARGLPSEAAVEDIRGALADSLTALLRISTIVRDLGVFARKKDEMELVTVTEPIDVAIKIANFETKYRAQVVRDYRPVPPITANRGRLQQLFLNLVINASHAIAKGDVEHNSIRVGTDLVDGFVRVTVADTGSGIAPENLARIFDPFFTTKPSGQGTGLGLAITNDIVHEHGGDITVESQLGRGTTFTLRFPANRG